jgi:hypothetical protein
MVARTLKNSGNAISLRKTPNWRVYEGNCRDAMREERDEG